FAGLQPDHTLIECGMGGALDATNIIKKPEVSVICPISYDHMQFLGNSLEEIAEAKTGIIKPGVPVVTIPQQEEAMSVINAGAKKANSPLYIADSIKNIEYHPSYTKFECGGKEYAINLLGTFQPQNATLAIKTAKLLNISDKAVLSGLQNAQWHYRFERIGRFILDGAHNEDAAKKLSESLGIYTSPAHTAFICGCFRDKEYDKIAALTAPYAAAVYCVTAPTERGLDSAILCETFKKHGANAYDSKTISAAMRRAISGGWHDIVVFGSLSILYEAQKLAEETQNWTE
ncbi:MAG: hypothetical protein IJR45_05535, partial [Firmicutes bacterium]|nr:hypothetical protein [Bacillota bacterium]